MSEIDDIFATKGKAKASSADTPAPKKKKKSKKDKKSDASLAELKPLGPSSSPFSKKRKAPETVVDPSQRVESNTKRHKTNSEPKKSTSKKEEAKFKDSRGTQGRKLYTS